LLETIPTKVPSGMNGFVFNTRRPLFADVRVREALTMLFDFEWINRNLYHGLYARTGSFYDNSELSARGVAADAFERALLEKFPGAVREVILEGVWRPPATDGSGRDRLQLRQALDLLGAAGWHLEGGVLSRDGRPFRFESLVNTKDQERLALANARALHRAGITADVRLVDAVQFDRRAASYDFDMLQYFWFASPSPGNEQSFYFGSDAAGREGTRNYMGARSPAADAAIAALLEARDEEAFVSSVRALDRALLSGFYVVPLFYAPGAWVARWAPYRHPEKASMWGFLPEVWWKAGE
jgi:peptide/nickel transport system substrate-binding protein